MKSLNQSGIKPAFARDKQGSSNKQKLSDILGNFEKRRRDNLKGSLENTKLLHPKTDSFRLGGFVETPVSGSMQPTASTGLKVLSKVHLLLHSKATNHKNSKTDGKKSFRSNAPSEVFSHLHPKSSSKQYDVDEYDTRERHMENRKASNAYMQMEGQRRRSPNYLSESSINIDKEARSPKERSNSSFKQSQLYLRSKYPKRAGSTEETENLKETLGDLVARLKAMLESRDSSILMLQSQNLSLQQRLEQKSQEVEFLKMRLSIQHNK